MNGPDNDLFDQDEEMTGFGPEKEEIPYFAPKGGAKKKGLSEVETAFPSYDTLRHPQANFTATDQRCISIYCPKGGVGKSTLAKELSVLFASERYDSVTGIPLRVLLVDCDWGHPSQKNLFNVARNTRTERISKWIRVMAKNEDETGMPGYFNSRFLDDYVDRITDNLHILTLTNNDMDAAMLSAAMVRTIMQTVANAPYDIVIYDNRNNGAEDERTVAVIEGCDTVLMIVTRESHTLDNVRKDIRALEAIRFDIGRIRFVMNSAPQRDGHGSMRVTPRDIENFFSAELLAEIPVMKDMTDINNDAMAAVSCAPNSPFVKAVEELAEALLPRPKREKQGLIERLFGKRRK